MKVSLNSFFHGIGFALQKCKFDGVFLKVKQYKILDALISGRDVIGVLPTGYGKSIIFQLLPFLHEYHSISDAGNIVIVVAPLNALIEDQIKSLRKRGVSAGMLRTKPQNMRTIADNTNYDSHSDSNTDENNIDNELEQDAGNELSSIRSGKFLLLFIHPEGFISCREGRKILTSEPYQKNVVCCVVDEAHLVYEWGEDFRPDFSKLSQLRALFPCTPMLALTASAHQSETHDPSKCLFAQFHAAQTDKMKSEILEQLTGESERHNIRVVFATVAIGLGVNIPNVRQVIHIGPPRTIESYYQEIGRAGRDGRSARAVLYYNGSDIATNKP
ncbi:ATP-dependent DNA helicase -like, partial [Paramuricea clavata]